MALRLHVLFAMWMMGRGRMSEKHYSPDDIARLGNAIYQRDIHDRVMPQLKGHFLVLDIESGDYEVDLDDLSAEEALRARRPTGVFFGLRIGYATAYALAGHMVEDAS
jgi:hypothetical protein